MGVLSRRPENKEMAYFQAVEDHFVHLRGHPLVLSPGDWHRVEAWRQQGIPLRVVLRSLTTVFERRARRGSQTPVLSLSYCHHQVEKEFLRHQRLGVGGSSPPGASLPAPQLLKDRAEILERSLAGWPAGVRMHGVQAISHLQRMALNMESCSRPPQEVEEDLLDLEAHLLQELKKGMPPADLAALRASCTARLAPFSQKMSRKVYFKTLDHALASEIRALFHLPFLSLLPS